MPETFQFVIMILSLWFWFIEFYVIYSFS